MEPKPDTRPVFIVLGVAALIAITILILINETRHVPTRLEPTPTTTPTTTASRSFSTTTASSMQSSVASDHNPLATVSTAEGNLLVSTRAWLAELEALSCGLDQPKVGSWAVAYGLL